MTTVRNEIYRDGVLVAVEEAPDPDLAPGAAVAAAAEALTAAIPDPALREPMLALLDLIASASTTPENP